MWERVWAALNVFEQEVTWLFCSFHHHNIKKNGRTNFRFESRTESKKTHIISFMIGLIFMFKYLRYDNCYTYTVIKTRRECINIDSIYGRSRWLFECQRPTACLLSVCISHFPSCSLKENSVRLFFHCYNDMHHKLNRRPELYWNQCPYKM